jgi:hypothetical protein
MIGQFHSTVYKGKELALPVRADSTDESTGIRSPYRAFREIAFRKAEAHEHKKVPGVWVVPSTCDESKILNFTSIYREPVVTRSGSSNSLLLLRVQLLLLLLNSLT